MRTWIAAAAMIITAGFAGSASAQSQPRTVTLHLATQAVPGSEWSKSLSKLTRDLYLKTQYRVAIMWDFNPVFSEHDLVDRMKAGKIEGAELTSSGLALIDPSIRALELPGLFDSVEESDYVAERSWPWFQKEYLGIGIVLADREEVGWLAFFSKSSINSVGSLQVGVWRDPDDSILDELYTQLGVTGVAAPSTQVADAFAHKTIDTCYATPASLSGMQWNLIVSTRSSLQLGYRIGAIVIDSAKFNALTPDDQRALLAALHKVAAIERRNTRSELTSTANALVRQGLNVVSAPPALQQAFDTAAQQGWKALVGKLYSQQDLDVVTKNRASFRAKHANATLTPIP
jgi:TRAP-type C4-dicarboxylate transport system substrate-binding protein